jgi:putative transposase
VASSYDNALAESVIGLYKTELIKPRRPWKGFDDLEIATAEWVDWFNYRRPFEYCDDLTTRRSGTRSLRSPPDPSDRRSLKLESLRTHRRFMLMCESCPGLSL